MTRFKHEIVVAVKDGGEDKFNKDVSDLILNNMPARSGWTALSHKVEEVENADLPWTHRASKWKGDRRWKAILDKVDEMSRSSKYRMSSRGTAMESEGGKFPTVSCKVKFDRKDLPDDGTHEMFLIEARENVHGGIDIKLDGPYTDSVDWYWAGMQLDNAIITPDWVHRTVSKDDPKAVALGGGGHGGAEFRFEIESPQVVQRLVEQGIKVEQKAGFPKEGEQIKWVVVTRNCWYQGVIPPKHRDRFKVNAEMVKGFNPGRTN